MLNVAVYSISQYITGSDGNILGKKDENDLAAVYDDNIPYEEVEKYVNDKVRGKAAERKDILTLPLETWEALSQIIKDNYKLESKAKEPEIDAGEKRQSGKVNRDGQMDMTVNIPENATNGDVIKAMFPDAEYKHIRRLSGVDYMEVKGMNGLRDNNGNWCGYEVSFYDDWWNLPYTQNLKGNSPQGETTVTVS